MSSTGSTLATTAAEHVVAVSVARQARTRPVVAIVTRHWGETQNEAVAATRLVAGALAGQADVAVVQLDEAERATYNDSVFEVHRVPVRGANPRRNALLRGALAGRVSPSGLPAAAIELLHRYDGEAPDVVGTLDELAPDAVVLVGVHQPWDIATLGLPGDPGRPWIVAIPFLGSGRPFPAEIARLVAPADRIGTVHPGERAPLVALAQNRESDIVALDLAIGVNRHATAEPLVGVAAYGEYVLLVRRFPAGGPRVGRAVNAEMLPPILPGLSVAEVDGEAWRICDAYNTATLPVNPSRVNFSRLVAHARATVDVRPPGPVGSIAIESMLLGVPVVVPDESAAQAHVAAANGGLWYRDVGELFDAVRVVVSGPIGARLAAQGRAYAQEKHGDIDAFVARMTALVLGPAAKEGTGRN
ncbi:MAG TPA: hypothetical protein VED84_01245 [Acidimicrobiales bacterium]|nr:hypothetical protein [Acidimicrobiales bacterium]